MKLVENMDQSIFREYDIRGIYPTELNEDIAYTIGQAFGTLIQEKGYQKALIGRDNRLSSPSLSESLIKGIKETGVDVINLGLVTTPMYYYARKFLKEDAGIMITASHNPKEYNGLKMAFSPIGNAYGDDVQAVYHKAKEGSFKTGNGQETSFSIKEPYLEMMKNSLTLGERKVKVVVDCGNGTGSIIVKELLDQFPIEYDLLYSESDPAFPNHQPDPSVSKNMVDLQRRVLELGYDLGIAVDGDADRGGTVDEKGQLIAADQYMIIMYRALNDHLKTRKALFDVKCSKSLMDELDRLGIEKVMYRTGNSYTNMMMQKGDFDFGGEYSGHLFFRDKFPGFDDGFYAGLRIIELLSQTEKHLSTFLEGIHPYESTEEIKITVTDDTKFGIVDQVKKYVASKGYEANEIDGIRVTFPDGWILIRASNTGPNVLMRVEALTKDRLTEIEQEFTTVLNRILL